MQIIKPNNEASPENTRFTLDGWIKVFRRFDRLEIPLESRQGMGEWTKQDKSVKVK